ncbi:MAG: hypothetical protein NC489_39780, partial [Ruminococcus flavefaciens]|nr:hypothetical protein [Ruminococcus flavefaciens]
FHYYLCRQLKGGGMEIFMDIKNIEQAVDLIYLGLVSVKSVPVQLRSFRILDLEMLDKVREALDFAIRYYKGKPSVPKKIAISMVDISGAFFFKEGFDDEMLRKLEDIGIELQEKALELFSEGDDYKLDLNNLEVDGNGKPTGMDCPK